MAKKKPARTSVDSLKHKDKRKNIPTAELQNFVKEDEAKPKKILYPRDPSLDPQLVWKGKDEQDQKDLEVSAVPLYIQEKIHPQVLIDDLRRNSPLTKGGRGLLEDAVQPSLFADFNGIEFEDLIDFYRHEQNWSNRMILGDSMLVMNSLAEKEGLKGKVQMIYFDPPYGIRFGSNWQVSTRKRDIKDGKAEDLTRQPEQIRAFRDTWELGIHSYLSYLRDRLVIARELLTETGSVFVQIGDENVHLVRCLMDEVMGSENFRSIITVKKTAGLGTEAIAAVTDFVLWYAKNIEYNKARTLYISKELEDDTAYSLVQIADGTHRRMTSEEHSDHRRLPHDARVLRQQILLSAGRTESCIYPIKYKGKIYNPTAGRSWATNATGMERLIAAGRVTESGTTLSYVRFADDFPVNPISNFWSDTGSGSGMEKVYVVQTNVKIVDRCLLMTTDPGDLVIDPTCGSGTTAYVAEQWGRRWITIDTSRVALALARTRLMSAKYPYYLLSDSQEGLEKESELSFSSHSRENGNPETKKLDARLRTSGMTIKIEGDIRKGFVYKQVPHITLKSIANNPDIKEGMSREEINAAISKHADTEILYDQPYTDNKRIRVAGPFTVESLSPHRILSSDEERPKSERSPEKTSGHGQFETMILENLKKAGVQNSIKNERLKFDRLEPFAGLYIQDEGEYTEGGKSKRVAVCIGPEHGTVSPELVKEAAKETLKGVGFDLLIVCGFAFDPHANEVAKQFAPEPSKKSKDPVVAESMRQYGKLTVLLARMNPDLAMGDELLKKTGAGNLFMIFGEPDIRIEKQPPQPPFYKGEFITVEIKGLDVYDPTTGQIRSHSTNDIACWFIDTDYNEESFFVRNAYFSGADEPYEKLKKALKSEIDESAWSTVYSTKSRPFPMPKTGKIAIKVINHYGDEVLKVYDVGNI
ncbi:MAG: site-specific DNA-methyltransferase [Nitrospinae bacterium]|nr:site-specific DNA-methyltransferase [Nitrospinota bacterium]